jgi:hypothetical protein
MLRVTFFKTRKKMIRPLKNYEIMDKLISLGVISFDTNV